MTITVKLFAAIRELSGTDELRLELPEGATIGDAKRILSQKFPLVEGLLSRSVIARNQDYALDTDAIAPGDELAVIPRVSGG
jgi:molybdopterin converting factor subunit 1